MQIIKEVENRSHDLHAAPNLDLSELVALANAFTREARESTVLLNEAVVYSGRSVHCNLPLVK